MIAEELHNQPLLRNGSWLIIGLFSAGLLWTGVRFVQTFMSGQSSAPESAVVIAAPPAQSQNRVVLSRWHLFGRADQPQVADAIAVEVPETELDLTLKGILSSTDPAQGRAIIADGDGLEQHYRLKDILPGGATVEGIEPTRIILLYRGQLETLTLEELRRAAAANPQSRSPSLTGQATSNANAANWQQLQNQLRTDPVAAARSIPLPIPVTGGDGKVRGFRPNPGTPPALLSQLGLRKSDIIISVNGSTVTDPAQMMGVWQQIQQTQSASVVVERNGRQVPLNITLKQ